MTARAPGRQPRPSRPAGTAGAAKRPVKRPADRPATARSTPAVDGTTALRAVPDQPEDAVEATLETTEPAADVAEHVPTDVAADVESVDQPEALADEVVEVEVVAEVTELDEVADVDEVADIDHIDDIDEEAYEPPAVPPIDARVLLKAILTPPEGIETHGLTDPLTGSVPTWRLDEEPIYLETVRDLGVPAVPEAGGGTGEVIVGEVVVDEVVVDEVVTDDEVVAEEAVNQ